MTNFSCFYNLYTQEILNQDVLTGNPKFFALVITSELEIIGTLPEAGNLKPNIWWNHQAPREKNTRGLLEKIKINKKPTKKC